MDNKKKWDKIRDVLKKNNIRFITFMDMPNSELTTAMLGFKHPDNEFFKEFRFPVVSTNDPDDFVKCLKQAAFEYMTTDSDKFCRDAIQEDITLLQQPLKSLIKEAKSGICDFTKKAFASQVSLAKEFLNQEEKHFDRDNLELALIAFQEQYDKGYSPDIHSGPWSVNMVGSDDILWEIEYDCYTVASYCVGGAMEREAKISDDLYKDIVKTVQAVYPNCTMSKDDQKAIKKNEAKGR